MYVVNPLIILSNAYALVIDSSYSPRTSASTNAPIFPIVIQCASEADAVKVSEFQELLRGINQSTVTREDVAALFVRTPNGNRGVLSNGPYYPVVVGHPVAVYHNWSVIHSV